MKLAQHDTEAAFCLAQFRYLTQLNEKSLRDTGHAQQKKAVYFYRGVWLYDHATNAWRKVNDDGGIDGAYCYDSGRDVVYAVTGRFKKDEKGNWVSAGPNTNTLRIYDIGTKKWTTPETTGDRGEGAASHTVFFTYDTVNDVAALFGDKHNVYDPNARRWTALPKTLSSKVSWSASSGFYDPELNAHFYFNAGDISSDPGDMWIYGYCRGGSR